jgi:hypothetical protein
MNLFDLGFKKYEGPAEENLLVFFWTTFKDFVDDTHCSLSIK